MRSRKLGSALVQLSLIWAFVSLSLILCISLNHQSKNVVTCCWPAIKARKPSLVLFRICLQQPLPQEACRLEFEKGKTRGDVIVLMEHMYLAAQNKNRRNSKKEPVEALENEPEPMEEMVEVEVEVEEGEEEEPMEDDKDVE